MSAKKETGMLRWIIRIVLGLIVVSGLCVVFAWSVLAIPYFSEFRSQLVSNLLTEQIGQPLLVNGDVSVVVSPISRVRASGVQIPSENMADTDLARLDSLEFDIDLFALMDRRIDINDLVIAGLQVKLLRNEDGTESWNEREQEVFGSQSVEQIDPAGEDLEPADDETDTGPGLLAFLKTRTVAFTNIQLIMKDDVSGFEYDFELKDFSLNQLDDGRTLGLTSHGQVNGQPFSLEGNYPEGAPFVTEAHFSSASLTFNGVPVVDDASGGFEGTLNLDISSVADLLDVLKLEGDVDGEARVQTRITNSGGVTSLKELSAVVTLAQEQLISLEGDIVDFGNQRGIDLQFNARLFPENAPPPRAVEISDLKLTNVATRIISDDQGVELDNLLISTNAFQNGLDKVGPIAIGRIRRTEEGTLAFQNIALQAGPLDAPMLVAQGNILNILELKDLDFAGKIDAPASLVLTGLQAEKAAAFGSVQVDFAFDDTQGALGITNLTAQSSRTDIWNMALDVKVSDVSTLDNTSVEFDLSVDDTKTFLTALDLAPVDAGSLSLGMMMSGKEGAWTGEFGLGAGTSELTASVSAAKKNGRPTITADIVSESMVIDDLKNTVAGVIELGKIGQKPAEDTTDTDVALQPLVLSDTPNVDAQPEKKERVSDVAVQPLVIVAEEGEILDAHRFLRDTDIYGQIEFQEVTGVQGVTRVSSTFKSEGGKAQIGPLDFQYGGGQFRFLAEMDAINAPRFVNLSGATSGWNLADILKNAGVDFDASGNLKGQFNVAGKLTNLSTFANTMRGSALVEMSNGQVATSLLELAGLGVFPWLFSMERRQGYTEIDCLRLPMQINSGSVSVDTLVAETGRVQLVAKGTVDWAGDALSIRAEPRPLGRPLARSAWPFNVFGKLSSPEFKLDIGGSRSRRTDGATQMPIDRQRCQPDILQLQ